EHAVALLGWEEQPSGMSIGTLTPAQAWLWAETRYRVWPDELRVGQTYSYDIDSSPPFTVHVDTSYLGEPARTRLRAVGADIFAPRGCMLSVRFSILPAAQRLDDAGIAVEIARIRREVVAHAGPIVFAPERWDQWLLYVAVRYLAPVAWALNTWTTWIA